MTAIFNTSGNRKKTYETDMSYSPLNGLGDEDPFYTAKKCVLFDYPCT